MLQPKKKRNPSQEGPAGSYMIGLPKSVLAEQAKTMKEASSGPRYKILKDGSGISTTTKTPLNQKKKIVEKGSYEKGKVEKYASKSTMMKHEKKETKSFEKKEGKKPSPTKMKKC